jgi:hypothetical protein
VPRVQFVRPRRRPWRAVRALAIVIVLLSVAAIAIPAVVRVATDEVGDRLDELVPAPARPAADPPRGLQGASLIRRANFAEAVAALRGAELGRPVLVRVAPERVDATLVDRQGRVHQVQVTFDGTLNRFSTTAGSANVPTVPFAAIEARAPERLVRRGAKRAGAAAGTINYVVFTAGVDLPWGAYFKGGEIVQGDRSGTPRRVL